MVVSGVWSMSRSFRCEWSSLQRNMRPSTVEPYDVCDGLDFEVALHQAYEETGGYSIVQAKSLQGPVPCCSDQHGQNYTCGGQFELFKYCVPGNLAVAVQATAPP